MVASLRIWNHLSRTVFLIFLCFGEKCFEFVCGLHLSLNIANPHSHLAPMLCLQPGSDETTQTWGGHALKDSDQKVTQKKRGRVRRKGTVREELRVWADFHASALERLHEIADLLLVFWV